MISNYSIPARLVYVVYCVTFVKTRGKQGTMGRLKAWQNLNPLFSGKYKKLLEEYGSKDYSRLLLQESPQDYLSYACGHCGHIQKLQVIIMFEPLC